jgi:hypothetical protein
VVEAPGDLRGASDGEQCSAVGVGGMSIFINGAQLSLLIAMVGLAVISGLVATWSIQEEDAGAAWIWVSLFGLASLVAAWSFWRLV